jgi:hypothetical protein
MNWKRGLLRLWLFLSISWVLAVGALAYEHFSAPLIDLSTGWESRAAREAAAQSAGEAAVREVKEKESPAESAARGGWDPLVPPTFEEEMLKFQNNREYAVWYANFALIPPAALFGLGLALAWVGAGFGRARGGA